MIKKIILPTLALGATLFAGTTAHEAKADEVDQSKLVDLANNHADELNSKPVQSGSYNIDFVENGQAYHFEGNGSTWSWSVGGSSQESNQAPSKEYTETPKAVEAPKAEAVTEQPTEVKEVPAPQVQKVETKQPTVTKEATSSSTGGSTKAQFLQAGGTEAMWDTIVMPESTGNPNATNGQYSGLFQMSPQSGNGTGSVAEQTKSAIKYANERYGSVDNAISARQAKGWW